ncbi:MFS transporter [Sporolactobacillus inulinus]|nr:MFS transporter [Sporolactobacillus inulinus]GEB77247.1 MFS transporter [Sporolactobacillus inulinus]
MQRKENEAVKKDDITVIDLKTARKAVFATSVGNAMEWFDFGIYSYLAVTLGKVFFPEMSNSVQLIYTFATFSIAFIARPIGGLVFGMMGDRYGRKKVLTVTLIMMALSTLSIGLIPSYAAIGPTAALLLLAARLVQGFSTGGEYSGAMTFLAESTPDKKRGVMTSSLEVGTLSGYIAGSGVVTLLTYFLSSEAMLSWGWRIPFLIAAPIGMIGFYLREHLEETPAFQAMKKKHQKEDKQVSIKEIFLYHLRPLIACAVIVCFFNLVEYLLLSYMPSHLSAVLGYGETEGLLLILIVMFIMIPIVVLMGHFGDRIGNKRVVQIGLVGLILASIPAFFMIGSGNSILVFTGLLVLAIFLSCFEGTVPSLLPSLFFTSVRYGGLAITYNISVSLFGGTTPMVLAWLTHATNDTMMPAYYMMAACVIGLIVMTFFVHNTSGKALRGSAPAVVEEKEIKNIMDNPEKHYWWKEERRRIKKRVSKRKARNKRK